jgi:hypothetical protein
VKAARQGRARRQPLAALLGSVLWPSFLTAGIATGIFFANVDPETLRMATFPHWEISRTVGYTVGFFMFWGVTALSSAVTLLLVRPPRPPAPSEQ